ncbi:MAG: hypothetical protein KDK70_41120 [Myxococcales bacterium]|nr:hypothetical protein [Myxococcales bacterium]
MSDATSSDVEERRIEALLAAQTRGSASAAEAEELALYVQQRPELRERVEQARRHGELGQGWLERVERDHQVQLAEQAPRARLERGLGLGLAGVGMVLWLLSPVIGAPVVGMGTLVLLYSIVRVRLQTHATDPYKDVIR